MQCYPSLKSFSFFQTKPTLFLFLFPPFCRVCASPAPSFTEDRLFNFTGGSPSRRPAPGTFSSAHYTCNWASRSFLTTSYIDVSFLALSTICSYVFICSIYVSSTSLKTVVIGLVIYFCIPTHGRHSINTSWVQNENLKGIRTQLREETHMPGMESSPKVGSPGQSSGLTRSSQQLLPGKEVSQACQQPFTHKPPSLL